MADILDTAGLSRPSGPSTLAQVPAAQFTAAERMQPYKELAAAEGLASNALEEASVSYSQEEGAKAVTRNPDGSVSVQTRPFVFSGADRAFNAAAKQSGLAMVQNDLTGQAAQMHAANLGNPAGFKESWDAYSKSMADKLRGSAPEIAQIAGQDAARLGTQHYDALNNQVAAATLSNGKTAIQARIQDEENQLLAIARQGGITTPEYQAGYARLHDLYGSLGQNPLWDTPKEKADSDLSRFASQAQAEHVVGQVDRTYNRQGRAEAQKALKEQILDNPQLNLNDAQRTSLYGWGLSRLEFLDGEHKAQVDANKQTSGALMEALSHPGHLVPDSMVDDAITKARNLGDAETALKLDAARRVNGPSGVMSAAAGMTDEQRVRTFGANGGNPAVAPAGAPAGSVAGAITTAAQRYNLDPGLLNRIAHIESRFDPNADNGTAKGLFQFVPGTWKQYGGGANVFDPSANADAAARLLVANRDSLRSGLGREPTGGEIYLAHQQGAQGALDLLRSPDRLATEVVGRRAVLGNGGSTSMTAGQFAQLWVRKVDGGGAPPAPGATYEGPPASAAARGGQMPFSPEQLRQNPFLVSTYTKAMVNDQDGMVQSASRVGDAILAGLKKDALPDPQTLGSVLQVAEQYPDKMAGKRDEILGAIAGWERGQSALGVPTGQGASLIAQAKQAAQGAPIIQQHVAEAMQDSYNRGVQAMKEDPVAEGARRGWYNPIGPLDFSNPGSIIQSVSDHGSAAAIRSSRLSEPQSLFSPKDAPGMQQALNAAPAPAVQAFFSAVLSQHPDVVQATLRDKAFVDTATGLTRTQDPQQYKAVMAGLDRVWQMDPQRFADSFGGDMVDRVQRYQVATKYQDDEALKKELTSRSEGLSDVQIKAWREKANTASAAMTPTDLAGAMKGAFQWGNRAPENPQAAAAMMGDYRALMQQKIIDTQGDEKAAAKLAQEKLATIWSISSINNGTFMQFAPEKYLVDDKGKPLTVGGSFDWVGKQIQDELQGIAKPTPITTEDVVPFADRGIGAPSGEVAPGQIKYTLVPYAGTQAAVAAGKPPPYMIYYIDPATGQANVNPKFFVPDVSKARAVEEARLRGAQAGVSQDRALNEGAAPLDIGAQLGINPSIQLARP